MNGSGSTCVQRSDPQKNERVGVTTTNSMVARGIGKDRRRESITSALRDRVFATHLLLIKNTSLSTGVWREVGKRSQPSQCAAQVAKDGLAENVAGEGPTGLIRNNVGMKEKEGNAFKTVSAHHRAGVGQLSRIMHMVDLLIHSSETFRSRGSRLAARSKAVW